MGSVRELLAVAAAGFLVMTAAPAWSVPIGVGAFSGGETVIDFDGLADDTVLGNQFAGLGITFQTINGTTTIQDSLVFPLLSPPNGAFVNINLGGQQNILFSTAVNRFGLDLDGSGGQIFIMDVFGAGGFIEQVTSSTNATFLGVQTLEDIVRVEVRSSTNGANFFFDDVRFEAVTTSIPEPGTLLLLGLGLAGLGVTRRCRTDRPPAAG